MKFQLVGVDEIHPHEKLQEIYPRQKTEINSMIDSIREFDLIEPIHLNKRPDGKLIIIKGHVRWLAIKVMGSKEIPAFITEVPEEDEVTLGIMGNNSQTEKTWATKGREAEYLLRQAKQHWKDIKKDNPEFVRITQWVAPKMAISPIYVSRLQDILDFDPLLLNQVDTGELKSFHQAWMKATGQQSPAKKSGLTKGSIIDKCNCPIAKDADGNICPLLLNYLEGKGGGDE